MAYISRDNVKEIIQNAPEGTSSAGIIAGLRKQGHTLEGYQDSMNEIPRKQTEQKKTVLDGVGNFLTGMFGGRKIGEFLGGTIASTPGLGSAVTGIDTTPQEREIIQSRMPSTGEVARSSVGSAATGVLNVAGGIAGRGAKFLPRVGQSIGLGAGFTGAKQIEQGDIDTGDLVTGAAIGGAVPVVGGAAGLVKSFLGGFTKRAAGQLTGKGTDVIDTILERPQAFRQGAKEAETVGRQIASDARNAISELNQKNSKFYRQGLEAIEKKYASDPSPSLRIKTIGEGTQGVREIDNLTKDEMVESIDYIRGKQPFNQVAEEKISFLKEKFGITVKSLSKVADEFENLIKSTKTKNVSGDTLSTVTGERINLSTQGVKEFLSNKLKDFDVVMDPKRKDFDFLESPFRKSDEVVLREVFETIEKWKDVSPTGLNRLAQKVSNFRKPGEQSDRLNSVITAVKRNIRDYVAENVPEVGELNKQYAKQADFLDNLEDILRIKGDQGKEEGIRKTFSAISTLFNTNKDEAVRAIQQLEKEMGIDILGRETGRQLATGATRSTASIGDFLRSAVQTVVSPRVVGETVAATGITQQKIQPLLRHLGTLEPLERLALLNFFASAVSQQEERPKDVQ